MTTLGNLRRLQNEVKKYRSVATEYESYFQLNMIGDDMYHWEATLYGPIGSIYEGYKFKLDIKLPNDYPYHAPSVKFITPIQHVNVNSSGDICMDILKNNWSTTQNMTTITMSIISLMSDPNLDDPFNHDLANLYKKNQKEYLRKIKDCCEKYKF